MSAPISILGDRLTYIKHPVILEMFYSRMHHVQLVPPEQKNFITLDDTKFDDGDWLIDVAKNPEVTPLQKHHHEHKKLSNLLKTFSDEKKTEAIELFFKENYLWKYNPEFHKMPHLYSMLTGISLCGKENTRNIPSFDMFPNYGYINKCKLCLRTIIGRIIK